MEVCKFCGEEAKHQFKNGNWCCSSNISKCKKIREKISLNNIGRICSEKCKQINKKIMLNGKSKEMVNLPRTSEKHKIMYKNHKKRMVDWQSERMNKAPRDPNKLKKLYEKTKQRMLNGGAIKCIKAIKKISNEEIKIRNMVKELYSEAEFQYPVFNYSLDVALVDKKIAIEYDGYYHFDSEEKKKYYKFRQEKIEKEGWKFLRYTMFDKFPSLEKIKVDLEKLIKEGENLI